MSRVDSRQAFPLRTSGKAKGSLCERVDMSTREKAKAQLEQVVGKVMRKTAHLTGKRTTGAKGAALQARGKARQLKEKGKDRIGL